MLPLGLKIRHSGTSNDVLRVFNIGNGNCENPSGVCTNMEVEDISAATRGVKVLVVACEEPGTARSGCHAGQVVTL